MQGYSLLTVYFVLEGVALQVHQLPARDSVVGPASGAYHVEVLEQFVLVYLVIFCDLSFKLGHLSFSYISTFKLCKYRSVTVMFEWFSNFIKR